MKGFLTIAVFAVFFTIGSGSLYSQPQMSHLRNGSLTQQKYAMLHYAYSGNKRVFWYLVKNLKRELRENKESDWNSELRQAAARALGFLKDKRGIPHLIAQFNREKDVRVKQAIVFGLGFYKEKEIKTVYQAALQTKDEDFLKETLRSVAVYGDKSLIQQVQTVKNGAQSDGVRFHAAYALMLLEHEADKNSAEVIGSLIHEDPVIRSSAAYFLYHSKRIEAIDALKKALEIENHAWVRSEMERARQYLSYHKYMLEEKEVPKGYSMKDLHIP